MSAIFELPIEQRLTKREISSKIYYDKQVERNRVYAKSHREEIREGNYANFLKIKEDPERYRVYLEKKREYRLKQKTAKLSKKSQEEDAIEGSSEN